MTSYKRHQTPYGTHLGVVINGSKFDVCTPRSFEGVKVHKRPFTSLLFTWYVITSPTHRDNHPDVVINRANFGVSRPSSFGTVNKNKPKKGKKSLLYRIR